MSFRPQQNILNPAGGTGTNIYLNTSNANGWNNDLYGFFSGYSISDSSGNTTIGSYALSQNQYGNYNTAIGTAALNELKPSVDDVKKKNAGSANTALGALAGKFDVSGQCNTYLGAQSGQVFNDKNVYIQSTAIGYDTRFLTGFTATNQIVIGTTGANVIIPGNLFVLGKNDAGTGPTGPTGPQGYTGPQGKSSAGLTGPTGPQGEKSSPGFTGPQGYTGSQGKSSAGLTGPTGPPGSGSTPGGAISCTSLFATAGITGDTINANNIRATAGITGDTIYANNITVMDQIVANSFATAGGYIRITGDTITNTGSITATNFTSTSDYRIKHHVIPIVDHDPELNVDKLNPVIYINSLTKNKDMGFIAHEIQEVYPFLVSGEKDGSNNQSVNYIGLIALLVKEIQELKKVLKSKSIL